MYNGLCSGDTGGVFVEVPTCLLLPAHGSHRFAAYRMRSSEAYNRLGDDDIGGVLPRCPPVCCFRVRWLLLGCWLQIWHCHVLHV
jgi:hypothetical protein